MDAVIGRHITGLTGINSGTRKKYRRNNERHIRPVLGGVPVDRLTREDVAAWLNGLELADKTKSNIHSVLSAAIAEAVTAGLAPQNVATGLRISGGSAARREPVYLSKEDVAMIGGEMVGQHATLARFLADSGLSFSEAIALRPRGLNLSTDNGSVLVTRAWKESAEGWMIGSPKTKRGRRTVVIPKATRQLLRAHVEGIGSSDLIFTGGAGGRLGNARFHTGIWQRLMNRLEDQLSGRPTIHDLRHSHASWLIAAGVPLTVIQRRLGHESIKTTSDTYGHLAADADLAAATALD